MLVCLYLFGFSRLPDESSSVSSNARYGEIRQGGLCLDTLGGGTGARVGLYQCHSSGGNQVCTLHLYPLWLALVS